MQADISEQQSIDRLFSEIDQEALPLKGVFHLAGSNLDKAIMNLTWEDFVHVMKPKMNGTILLVEKCKQRSIDLFCSFSSLVSVIGSPGQSNYGAANAFLDAMMISQRDATGKWLSINWGPWDNLGMTAKLSPEKLRRWKTLGVEAISIREGEEWLEECLVNSASQSLLAKVDWTRFLRLFPPGLHPSLLGNFLPTDGRLGQASDEWKQIKNDLQQMQPGQRSQQLVAFVERIVRQVLGINDEAPIDPQLGFTELRRYSLMGIELRNGLQQHAG